MQECFNWGEKKMLCRYAPCKKGAKGHTWEIHKKIVGQGYSTLYPTAPFPLGVQL